jgi:Uri superfamily endonuclease
VQIGRWREIEILPGYYIYIGSAFGPGGVRARVLRHLRRDKPKHWHIDYLREFVIPLAAWIRYETTRLEHKWAQVFICMRETTPIRGFGCSDCKCYSHLFHSLTKPDSAWFDEGETFYC